MISIRTKKKELLFFILLMSIIISVGFHIFLFSKIDGLKTNYTGLFWLNNQKRLASISYLSSWLAWTIALILLQHHHPNLPKQPLLLLYGIVGISLWIPYQENRSNYYLFLNDLHIWLPAFSLLFISFLWGMIYQKMYWIKSEEKTCIQGILWITFLCCLLAISQSSICLLAQWSYFILQAIWILLYVSKRISFFR